MPVKSSKQIKFMMSHMDNNSKGPSPEVAKEFLDATPKDTKSKFGKKAVKKKQRKGNHRMVFDSDSDYE